MPVKTCKHRWSVWGHRGMAGVRGRTVMCESCKTCDARRERPATEPERKKIAKEFKEHELKMKLMHRAWKPAQKILKEYEGCRDQEHKMEASSKLERLSEKFPEYVHYVRVDDDYFSGSDLWFFPHWYDDKRVGQGYWGTSVVFIAQCSPDPIVKFFLYPDSHMRGLVLMTKKLDAMARRLNKGKRFGSV